MPRKLLGQYLMEGRVITFDQLQDRALELQLLQLAGTNLPVGDILVQLGQANENDIVRALAQQERDRKPIGLQDRRRHKRPATQPAGPS